MSPPAPSHPSIGDQALIASTDPPGSLRRNAVTGRHLRALNGLRGLAVAAVVAYHLGFSWASGGYLGVDLFFVLSGFLITSLLLEEWVRTAALNLAAFWGRRARRLLPALFLVVAALGLYLFLNGRFGGPGANGSVDLSDLRGDALATLLYVGNWHAIFAHQSYFAQFSAPSPLQHTWSLAIEEQFYLVWPPVVLVLMHVARRHWRRIGLGLCVVGGLASAALMAVLFHPGTDPTRAYFGTDTRAFDLMAGCALAFMAAALPQPSRRVQGVLHWIGPIAGAGLAVFWVTAGTPNGLPKNFMFEGGFLVCAVLAALVVSDARLVVPGRFARALSVAPVHYLGTISYGVYLWHWPIIVYMTTARTGLSSGPLDVVRIAATLLAATLSYFLVEQPIRRADFKGRVGLWLAPVTGIVTAVLVVVATVPAVADPGTVAKVASVTGSSPRAIAGAGGFGAQARIALPRSSEISTAHRLRVLMIGDSVMQDAAPGIKAALEATGDVTTRSLASGGFGLSVNQHWIAQTLVPAIASMHPQVIVGTWSWDDDGPTTPNALEQPARYATLLERSLRTMLRPGNGVAGVVLLEFPPEGFAAVPTKAEVNVFTQRDRGRRAWNTIVRKMASVFPGRVMYLPVADAILRNGRYSSWLPPIGDPSANAAQWVRVRKLDEIHLCAAGSARIGDAVSEDFASIFGLKAPPRSWLNGDWTSDPDFNDPPGACPNDHPSP